MLDCHEDINTAAPGEVSRRRFLRRVASYGAAAWAGARLGEGQAGGDESPAFPSPSKVCEVVMKETIIGRRAHPALIQEMVSRALCLATRTSSAGQAWRRLVTDEDTILVKFNRSGAEALRTTAELARAVVASLKAADISPAKVMLLEVPPGMAKELGTRRPPQGWAGKEYDFGSGRDQFLAALHEATAIINIPFLKTHNLAGMTGCLKNLSHGLVKHPGRYHDNGCSPYIGDIVGSEAIRPKLRLNLVNALRVMVDRGPDASEQYVDPGHLLILSTDPVAADTCGLIWLNRLRKERELPPIGGVGEYVPYLQAAQAKGLGSADMKIIKREFFVL